MNPAPRWVEITATLVGVVVLTTLGNYYHRWVLGTVAGITAAGLVHLCYRVAANAMAHRRQRRRAAAQHAVIVYLSTPVTDDADLETLETELAQIIEARELGEYDGNEIGPTGADPYMYGDDGERLFQGVEATLRSSPLCGSARVVIRPGPPGTAAREVRL